jgi:hypothetical protein
MGTVGDRQIFERLTWRMTLNGGDWYIKDKDYPEL